MVLEEKGIIFVLVIFFDFFMTVESEDYKLKIMAIEEEFDIEISDEEQESLLSHSFEEIINFVLQQLYAF